MRDETILSNGWYYFENDVSADKDQQKGDLSIVSIRLPNEAVQLRLVWFPEDKTSEYFANILASTLHYVKEEWEFFLRMHLRKYSQSVVVFCDGKKHAAKLGVKPDWDFNEIPMAVESSWREFKADRTKTQQILIIRLILSDKYLDCAPEQLVQYAVGWVNVALLNEVSGLDNSMEFSKCFWKAVRKDVKKIFK